MGKFSQSTTEVCEMLRKNQIIKMQINLEQHNKTYTTEQKTSSKRMQPWYSTMWRSSYT